MKKLGFGIIVLGLMLGLTSPMLDASARHSGAGVTHESSLFHHLTFGHQNGQALTEHSAQGARAWSHVWVRGVTAAGGLTHTAPSASQMSRVTVTANASTERNHRWGN